MVCAKMRTKKLYYSRRDERRRKEAEEIERTVGIAKADLQKKLKDVKEKPKKDVKEKKAPRWKNNKTDYTRRPCDCVALRGVDRAGCNLCGWSGYFLVLKA
jgi:hypothetical protein